ncbi:hypothetical protein LIER_28840 [Lithospermum erythrorhizon]|uniref:Uncharacterized protein n=1 Tax=Lithospermum erythrorhizon TaxID=34254 RepID=A0AAV3RIP1_LITER
MLLDLLVTTLLGFALFQGKTLRELIDMADEVLAHIADGHALHFSFIPALHCGMECYFEKVGSTLQVVSEADYRSDFLLPVLEEAQHEAETRIVHQVKRTLRIVPRGSSQT